MNNNQAQTSTLIALAIRNNDNKFKPQTGFAPRDKRLPIPAVESVGFVEKNFTKPEGGSGVASPLNESTTKPRTYHTNKVYTDPTGLLTFIVKPLNEIYFDDSSVPSNEIKFKLNAPT